MVVDVVWELGLRGEKKTNVVQERGEGDVAGFEFLPLHVHRLMEPRSRA